ELNAVAKSLLGMQENGLAAQILAMPLRLREVARSEIRGTAPAPFIAGPALFEITERKAKQRLVPVRLRQLRLKRDGAIEALKRFFVAIKVAKRTATIDQSKRQRLLDHRGVIVGQCLRRPIEIEERVAAIVLCLRVVRFQLKCMRIAG